MDRYDPYTDKFLRDTQYDILSTDCISRQDAINKILGQPPEPHYPSWYAEQIKELPSAQPETAKRIVGKSRDGMTLWYQCDMCNEPVDAKDNYCRGCGRRLTDG